MAEQVLSGAIALIYTAESELPIGKMKTVRWNENIRRVDVRGIGTILPSESDVVEWGGTLTCDFYEIDYDASGVPGAIIRKTGVASSQAGGTNAPSFEDNLVLDMQGVTLHVFKKITDVIDPVTKLINPTLKPYAIIGRLFITADNVNISEGSLSGRDQSFNFIDPVIFPVE